MATCTSDSPPPPKPKDGMTGGNRKLMARSIITRSATSRGLADAFRVVAVALLWGNHGPRSREASTGPLALRWALASPYTGKISDHPELATTRR